MDWVELLVTKDLAEAEFTKGLLEAAAIPVVLQGENAALIFPGVIGEIRVLVPADWAEAARQVLNQDTTEMDAEE
ncbi:MAG TPA: DUF2007 domain-containing protein [Firmicutes bacterium]|jgi:hypothetical protein|nr:DUF2007 domain-containing protein [Bacillota bacterium]HOQ24331.1 DUF2007 domain-containing protein [Bacillota bacterium]HPT67491.1 DUF2007 domain-containing protein [Bacillota bacterium]